MYKKLKRYEMIFSRSFVENQFRISVDLQIIQ